MKLVGVSLLAVLLVNACTVQEKRPPSSAYPIPDSIKSTRLLLGVWQLREKFSRSPSLDAFGGEPNEVEQMPRCDQDDVEEFTEKGKWWLDEGQTTCHPQEPSQLAHGRWWLSTQDSLSIQYNDGELIQYRIKSLTDSTLTRVWQLNKAGKWLVVEEKLVQVVPASEQKP